jgi:hypothetical protein
MIDKISIKFVDELPMVNLTNSFLVKKVAQHNFKNELANYFLYWKDTYFAPRARKVTRKYCGLINGSWSQINIYCDWVKVRKYKVDEQKKFVDEFLASTLTFDILISKLTATGKKYFGLGKINPFTFLSYEELFVFLTTDKKQHDQFYFVSRLLVAYLHGKGLFLWPLDEILNETKWSRLVGGNDSIICKMKNNKIYSELRKATFTNHQRKTQNLYMFRLLLSTKWSSLRDVTKEDLDKAREILKQRTNPNWTQPLDNIGAACAEFGYMAFESHTERAGKTISKGRLDGSFRWFEKSINGKDYLNYWLDRGRDYATYIRDNTNIQDLASKLKHVNKYYEYILYADDYGEKIKSVRDIKRDVHVAWKSKSKGMLSFINWLFEGKKLGHRYRSISLGSTKMFLQWIIETDGLSIQNPILDIDVPGRPWKPFKTHRMALTMEMFRELREILINDPPPYYEIVFENGVEKRMLSPTLPAYTLTRLMLSIRHNQSAYLDKDKVLHRDGFLISGDKNQNRELLLIIPKFDDELVKKIEECIVWQKKYNYTVEPVWYGGNTKSPFGKVSPLFRFISRSNRPVSRITCAAYMIICLLKLQKKMNLEGNHQLIYDKQGKPLDMSQIDPDSLTMDASSENFTSKFDLHSFRVTAATVMFEAGVDIDTIMTIMTGHASYAQILHYVLIRDGGKKMEEAFQKIINIAQNDVLKDLENDIDAAVKKHNLVSRFFRLDDKDINGVEQLKQTPRAFWRPLFFGICPTGACPEKLDGRCSLCPLLISGPPYKAQIAMMSNLYRERIIILASEMKAAKTTDNSRRARLESLIQEWVGYTGWQEFIDGLEVESGSDKIQLYSQFKYQLAETSPIMAELQRSLDISLAPELYTEQAYNDAKSKLMYALSRLPEGLSVTDMLKMNNLPKMDVIKTTAQLFLKELERGVSEDKIISLFSPSSTILPDNAASIIPSSIKEGTD